jgi:hypothetical protein
MRDADGRGPSTALTPACSGTWLVEAVRTPPDHDRSAIAEIAALRGDVSGLAEGDKSGRN